MRTSTWGSQRCDMTVVYFAMTKKALLQGHHLEQYVVLARGMLYVGGDVYN